MSKKLEGMVGRVFPTNSGGDLVVIGYVNSKDVIVKFLDEHGYIVSRPMDKIREGSIKNLYTPSVRGVGYIGDGEYRTYDGNKESVAYIAWTGALRRCYDSSYHEAYPTYIGCHMCDEWKNFQVFAKWYTEHEFYGAGYHLDKDLLLEGNKIYSPDACTLIPSRINSLLGDCGSRRGEFLQGVSYDSCYDKFLASISINGRKKNLGRFKTPEEAYLAYKTAKELQVKVVALEWKGRIDERVFNKLMSWTLD